MRRKVLGINLLPMPRWKRRFTQGINFKESLRFSLKINESGDYETAIKTLRGYIRDNIKPEEIHGGV